MKRHLFFLSHVRGRDDEWVAQFFRDLSAAVAERTGLPAASVGLRADPASREAQLDSMREAVTLVALTSPQYGTRSYCRAEWAFFHERAEVQTSRTGRPTDAIIPVVWVPHGPRTGERTGGPPGHAPHPQGRAEAAPSWPVPLAVSAPVYQQDGLLHLLRLGARYRSVYQEVVAALATRLAQRRGESLPDLPGFTARHSVLPPRPAAPTTGAVSVVVAASGRAGLPEERRSRQYYGPSPLDWSPYRPEQPHSLVALVEETAADLELLSEVLPLDGAAARDLAESAEDQERFVVLLVDAWAATLRRQRQLLAPLDARPPGSTAVLEPRNEVDAESAEHGADLDRALDEALPRLREAGTADQLRRWGLPDSGEFIVALRRALVSAQNDALKTTVNRVDPGVLPAARFETLPQLGKFGS